MDQHGNMADPLADAAQRAIQELARDDLARALLSLVDSAGMPDTFWQTDSRVAMARLVLDVPEDGRYTHAKKWAS